MRPCTRASPRRSGGARCGPAVVHPVLAEPGSGAAGRDQSSGDPGALADKHVDNIMGNSRPGKYACRNYRVRLLLRSWFHAWAKDGAPTWVGARRTSY